MSTLPGPAEKDGKSSKSTVNRADSSSQEEVGAVVAELTAAEMLTSIAGDWAEAETLGENPRREIIADWIVGVVVDANAANEVHWNPGGMLGTGCKPGCKLVQVLTIVVIGADVGELVIGFGSHGYMATVVIGSGAKFELLCNGVVGESNVASLRMSFSVFSEFNFHNLQKAVSWLNGVVAVIWAKLDPAMDSD